jgi:excisionase family DNA binding protein
MEPAPKVLYSREEAAQALAISVSTLQIMIANGTLRSCKFGRLRLIHRDEIERIGRRIVEGKLMTPWPEKERGTDGRLHTVRRSRNVAGAGNLAS